MTTAPYIDYVAGYDLARMAHDGERAAGERRWSDSRGIWQNIGRALSGCKIHSDHGRTIRECATRTCEYAAAGRRWSRRGDNSRPALASDRTLVLARDMARVDQPVVAASLAARACGSAARADAGAP